MKQKKLMAVVSVALLLCAAVGGTLAWVTAQTPAVTNTFSPADVKVDITEDFDKTTKENIRLKNDGDIPVFLRAAVIVGWEKDGNTVYDETGTLPDLPDDKLGDGWTQKGEYYYYTASVEPTASTTELFTVAITEPETKPDGARLQVTILAEGIQSTPRAAIADAWGEEIATLLLGAEPEEGGGAR